ncbi:MAG: hypothetical protein WCP85_25195 [Mariniphaga sp.]
MTLLPNEAKIITSDDEKIILTNHRIQMTDSVWGQSFFISIFLEDISSITIKYKSNIIFIILTAFCALGSAYYQAPMGLVPTLIFFAVFWFTRKHVISISSNGAASLIFQVEGMDDKKISDFVYEVSLAKQTRVNQLHKL